MRRKSEFLRKDKAVLWLPLLALAVTVVVELFNHKAFTEGTTAFLSFVKQAPLALLVNALIVLLTMAPAFFLRRRVFWCALVSAVWLIGGGVNGARRGADGDREGSVPNGGVRVVE